MERYNRTQICAHLRSKNMYMNQDPSHLEHHTSDISEIFWCNLTMQPCGPDDRLCDSDSCREGRECFKNILG